MIEDFNRVVFLYGMAIVLAIGKAFTLWIWNTLPKPRPPLRQEMMEAWRHRRARIRSKQDVSAKPETAPASPDTEAPLAPASGPAGTEASPAKPERSPAETPSPGGRITPA